MKFYWTIIPLHRIGTWEKSSSLYTANIDTKTVVFFVVECFVCRIFRQDVVARSHSHFAEHVDIFFVAGGGAVSVVRMELTPEECKSSP